MSVACQPTRRIRDGDARRSGSTIMQAGAERARSWRATDIDDTCAECTFGIQVRVRARGRNSGSIREARHGRHRPTPLAKWHEWTGEPTLADALLTRLVRNAYEMDLRDIRNEKRHDRTTEQLKALNDVAPILYDHPSDHVRRSG